jgi:dipeptidyl aminopeptidase/acylaminoacyl peptidase
MVVRIVARGAFLILVLAGVVFPLAAQRRFRPEDLFRVRRPGAVTWSPDGRYATVELSRPGRALAGAPSNELALIDLKSRALRVLSPASPGYLGFFNATWSPGGRRLAFLSVDEDGVVRVWTWSPATATPIAIRDLDVRVPFLESPIVWIDDTRLAVTAWEPKATKSGSFYRPILKGRNALLPVLDSGGTEPRAEAPVSRLWSIDLRTNAKITLVRGDVHQLKVSPDGRFISFLSRSSLRSAVPYLSPEDVEAAYSVVSLGTEQHVLDSATGHEVPLASMPISTKPSLKPQLTIPSPASDARILSVAPTADTAFFLANSIDGTHFWLSSVGLAPKELWHANEWVKEIKSGKTEAVPYKALDGTALTAWLLLPPDDGPADNLPMVTVVYPGTTWGANSPSSFSIFTVDFEHPQLFAALGYAVLWVSMPEPKDAGEALWAKHFANGVLPAIDAAVAGGRIDPDRIAIQGQSNGGYAALSLVSQTHRFRSAIASAAPVDFASLYGTFYGDYRSGDSGDPRTGQLLRMLQLEKGVYQFAGPPWAVPDVYRSNSPISHVDHVETPVMLIQGDLDFVPIQQGEEYFTALYRQGKRAEFVRYPGEWHTISDREHVLDMWNRIRDWLAETLAARK